MAEIGIMLLFGVIVCWAIVSKSNYEMMDVYTDTFEEDLYVLTKSRAEILQRACDEQGVKFEFPTIPHDVVGLSDVNELFDCVERLIQKDEVLTDALKDNARDMRRAMRFYNCMARKYNEMLVSSPNYLMAGNRTVKMAFCS